MGTPTGNTVLTSVISGIVLEVMRAMTKEAFTAEKQYLAAADIAGKLLRKGLLTQEEYAVIDTKLREKYGPKFGSLLSEMSCLSSGAER